MIPGLLYCVFSPACLTGVLVKTMSNSRETLSPAMSQALEFAERLTTGVAVREDVAALEVWCAQSVAHAEAFAEAMTLRDTIKLNAAALRADIAARETAVAPHSSRGHFDRRYIIGGALAASVAGAAVLIRPPMAMWPSLAELGAQFRTERFDVKTVSVGKARVEFNRVTSASLKNGRLHLIEGEVLVEIAQSAPLTLSAGSGTIEASAAKLDVLRVSENTCVTCLSGEATVLHPKSPTPIRILAGQQVRYDQRQADAVETADLESTLAWRHDLIIFRNTPLKRVIENVNRYRNGQILLADQTRGDVPVSGVFKIGETGQIIKAIQSVTGLSATRLPNQITLLS